MSTAALAILVPLGLLATASDEESRQSSLAWIDSTRGEEHLRQALVSARRRDWPAAFREIQLAHRANPSDAVACYNFGVLHFNNENYADAVPWSIQLLGLQVVRSRPIRGYTQSHRRKEAGQCFANAKIIINHKDDRRVRTHRDLLEG
jgi:hypothetical protein